ncbi:hypothetical protein DFH07DRAFT_142224 [Mycena maculata]|uniref:Uncharacterized protein n=1 Tax=Mycena maculata TaxID=230809 RepID=A0AAD7I123_9AGAR|nr:hypothetical protein DFH07DRAFT_142224 [Mycena maculata]
MDGELDPIVCQLCSLGSSILSMIEEVEDNESAFKHLVIDTGNLVDAVKRTAADSEGRRVPWLLKRHMESLVSYVYVRPSSAAPISVCSIGVVSCHPSTTSVASTYPAVGFVEWSSAIPHKAVPHSDYPIASRIRLTHKSSLTRILWRCEKS